MTVAGIETLNQGQILANQTKTLEIERNADRNLCVWHKTEGNFFLGYI